MHLSEAEIVRRKVIKVLTKRSTIKLLADDTITQTTKDLELSQKLGEPVLEQSLSFNMHRDWVARVNCYGHAIGTPDEWDNVAKDGWFLLWGQLSRGFRTKEFAAQLSPQAKKNI
jgi:hypothetical protein